MITKIKGIIKEYQWGSSDFLPRLFGYDAEGQPQAEAWFGTHPQGEALISDGTPLEEILKEDPERLLGNKDGSRLPLMLKLISVRTPFSIECHPDKTEAKEGFLREASLRDQGIAAKELDYKDSREMAELIYALTPMTLLCGFRHFEKIKADLERIIPRSFEKYFAKCDDIPTLFLKLEKLEAEELKELTDELVWNEETERESDDPRFFSEREIVLRSFRLYGSDPGLLAPYLMNLVRLLPGQALFIAPCTLHSYVFGNGVVVMSLSENVLTGGFSHSSDDIDELVKIMDKEPLDVEKCIEDTDPFSRTRLLPQCEEFTTYILQNNNYNVKERAPSLVLAVSGGCIIESRDTSVTIEQGECAFVSYDENDYVIKAQELTVQASVPTKGDE